MKPPQIHIEEENLQFFWGLVAVVCIALAAYRLFNAFMTGSWTQAGYEQLISLLLFSIGFYGIIRITSPLFHFVLKVSDAMLVIEIWNEGDEPVDINHIKLNRIKELRISSHTPRLPNEALFDFSTSYYLLYKDGENGHLQKLIELNGASFTLKVEDIRKVMAFLLSQNSEIHVPDQDALFIDLNELPASDYTTAE